MTPTIVTAAELYREIKKRGLELKKSGRDNTIFAKLRLHLSCPDEKLQRYLDKRPDITAELFLRTFFIIAEPFVEMYQAIWLYLAECKATRSDEFVAINFSFSPVTGTTLDLEQFRRQIEEIREVMTLVSGIDVPLEKIEVLFELIDILVPTRDDRSKKAWHVNSYNMGEPCSAVALWRLSAPTAPEILASMLVMYRQCQLFRLLRAAKQSS